MAQGEGVTDLRPYQADLLARVREQWAQGRRNVLMQLATGGGKTVCLADEMRQTAARGHAVAVLVHRNELVGQLSVALAREGVTHNLLCSDKMRRLIVQEHLELFGTLYYDPNSPVLVLSVDTAVRRLDALKQWGRSVRLWVCDEGHHAVRTNKWGTLITKLFTHPECRGLLPTATPTRANGQGLGSHADGFADVMVQGPSGKWLIEQGYLSRYKVAAVDSHVREYLTHVGSDGDWTPAALREAYGRSQIAGDVVRSYLELSQGRIGITFTPGVKEAEALAIRYSEAGVPAAVMTGETELDDRRHIWDRLVARKLLQVVAVDVISEGTDVPAVEDIGLARPTMSLGLHLQQIGRGLRPSPGKTHLQIRDHVGNFVAHRGGPDTERRWTLDRRAAKRTRDPDDIPVKICVNVDCGLVFEGFRRSCPYCGTMLPPGPGRAGPDKVDGVVSMLDDETLARIRGDIAEMDKSLEAYSYELARRRMPQIGIVANVKRLAARQEAQRTLRAAMDYWGGAQRASGLTDDEMQARFYLTFGVDVLTAQTLGIDDAARLTEAVVKGTPFELTPEGAWSLDLVWGEACLYETRQAFAEGSGGAHTWARRNGVMDEVCAHMQEVVRWDRESVLVEARKYETRWAFKRGSGGAYLWARLNGVMDEVCAHMQEVVRWDRESVLAEARKYETRQAFAEGSGGAHTWAHRNGVMDEVCAHMQEVVRWDRESVLAEARKYETRWAFGKGSGGAYVWACRNGVLDEVCAHMQEVVR